MSEIALYSGPDGSLAATADGLCLAPPVLRGSRVLNERIAIDARVLLEQGLAEDVPAGVLLRWSEWALALELGIQSLTSASSPSHLLLEIERRGELGRKDFKYVIRWHEGALEIPVNRVGAFVRLMSGTILHLDGRTLSIVEAAEAFNGLSEAERGDPRTAYAALSKVHAGAAGTAVLMDAHLKGTSVLVPPTLGLTIRTDDDGSITFLPHLPGAVESSRFTAHIDALVADVRAVEHLTLANGRRVRVLLSDAQQEVIRRMQKVRRLAGDDAKRLTENPEAMFDGLGEEIDLTHIEREYGPRVIGVGALPKTSNLKADGGPTVFERMGFMPPSQDPAPETSGPEGGGPKRSAVSIDVLDADNCRSVTLRLETDEQVAALHDAAAEALRSGSPAFEFQGYRVTTDPALATVLARHLPGEAAGSDDSGEVGASGHLYLLINDHDESLTPELVVDPFPEVVGVSADVFHRPESLAAGILLKGYQADGVHWLATCRAKRQRRGGVLADDMGLGKTLQLLTHMASLIETGAIADTEGVATNGPWRPILIVAPLLLVETETWATEMRDKFVDAGRIFEPWVVLRDEGIRKVTRPKGERDPLGKPLLDPERIMAHKVVITTYETLMAYQHSLAQRIDGRPMWSLVIFDEAQEIKSPKAKVSLAAKALDARFKIAATGTPVETRLRDLWNLLDTVEPTHLGTQRDFVASLERPAMNAPDERSRVDALDQLRVRLRYRQPDAFLLRRDKSILEDLPIKHEHRVSCELTSVERRLVQRIVGDIGESGKQRNPLRALQQLHLASQHPILAGAAGDATDHAGLLASSSRLRALIEILRGIQAKGEKVLIFARSVDAQRMLAAVIGGQFGVTIDIINGQTGVGDSVRGMRAGEVRKAMLDRFQKSPGFGAIVLSPFVAGVGLTITEANHVVHYGRWWNPAVEGQATDRAHRIGQKREVHVYFLIAVDSSGEIGKTFDQAVDELILARRALATDFLMPHSEDADAAALAGLLSGRPKVAGREELQLSTATALECRAAALMREAKARGVPCVWLGRDGLFGAHLLVREAAHVQVVRLAERATQEAATSARASAAAWGRLLVDTPVAPAISALDLSEVGLVDRPAGEVRAVTLEGPMYVEDQALASVDAVLDRLGLSALERPSVCIQ